MWETVYEDDAQRAHRFRVQRDGELYSLQYSAEGTEYVEIWLGSTHDDEPNLCLLAFRLAAR